MHKYEIMKVIKPGKVDFFEDLEGMELIVQRFVGTKYKNDSIMVPLHLKDYDKYFRWLFEQVRHNWWSCSSKTFEDFKVEINEYCEDFSPCIREYLSEFEYIRDYTVEDMNQHNIDYKQYFN